MVELANISDICIRRKDEDTCQQDNCRRPKDGKVSRETFRPEQPLYGEKEVVNMVFGADQTRQFGKRDDMVILIKGLSLEGVGYSLSCDMTINQS